ncbi:MAG: pyridoxamine 5'-phosphate oxidase family protein [Desulfobacterales bacterium]|nr:MAG: pyridoxamine 5'-phosphate oxidase family protein [Desulfobacterales bacterium]
MRREEKEITAPTEIEAIIRQAAVCRLAMVDGDRPYMVPLCFGYRSGELYFHTASEGKKLDILKKNNRVCFEFETGVRLRRGPTACEWGMHYRSVIGFGVASLIEDAASKRRALDIIMANYADGTFEFADASLNQTVVIKIDVASMTGKASE